MKSNHFEEYCWRTLSYTHAVMSELMSLRADNEIPQYLYSDVSGCLDIVMSEVTDALCKYRSFAFQIPFPDSGFSDTISKGDLDFTSEEVDF